MFWIDASDRNQNNKQKSYIADAETDIETLPTSAAVGTGGETDSDNAICSKGSKCLCIGNSSIYYLDSTDTWQQFRTYN